MLVLYDIETSMKIEKVEIKGLFGKKDICWELNPQVNVLVGVNGSGKSTILSIIYCMLNNLPNSHKNMIFEEAKIYFKDKIKPIVRKNNMKARFVDIHQIAIDMATQIEQLMSKELGKNKPENLKEKLLNDIQEKMMKDVQEIDGRKALIVQHTEQVIDNPEIFEHLHITMISTLNLSANAIFEFKGSNEEVLNILDLEMDKVLNQFNYKSDNEMKERLINALNFFLNMVGKNIKYEENTILYFDTEIQKELKFSDLSSGERQLVYMLVQVALNSTEKEKSSIVLMDEPEISLHIDWQEYFIHQLRVLSPNTQFIIVTHNPALIMNGWNAVYKDIEEITQ